MRVVGSGAASLRAHLLALTLALLLPALSLGAATTWRMAENYRAASRDRLSDTAAALALAVDREIEVHLATLTALAMSPLLDTAGRDPAAFDVHTRRASAALGSPIELLDAAATSRDDLQQAIAVTFGGPEDAGAAQRSLSEGQPVISNVSQDVRGFPAAAVLVPVTRPEHGLTGILATRLQASRLSALLELAGVGADDAAFAMLTDSRGTIAARSNDAGQFVGRQTLDWFSRAASGTRSGVVEGRALAGHDVILAFRRLAHAPGWTVAVAEPLAAYRASWLRPLAVMTLGGLAVLLAGLAAAAWLARRVLSPVRALIRQAEATAEGAASGEHGSIRTVVSEFEQLRISILRADAVLGERAADIAAGEARLRAVVETAADAIVVIDEAGTIQSFNRAAEAIFGYAADEAMGQNVSMLMQDEDAGRHDGHLAAYRQTGVPRIIGIGREVTGRRKDGSAVPVDLAIADWRDGDGKRFFTGIMRDISARKAEDARKALLMREVDHRAKNALAVVQSLVRLTPADDPSAFAKSVQARIAALARAHSLLAEGGWSGADFRTLAERELDPIMASHPGVRAPQAAVLSGPPVALSPTAVQPLAMMLHELAANAVKHGALSQPSGRVEVSWQVGRRAGEDGMLRLRWAETGDAMVQSAPSKRGFGMRAVEATVRGQLRGSIEWHWERTGLVAEIVLPLARIGADADRGDHRVSTRASSPATDVA